MPLLELFGGGMGKERKYYIFWIGKESVNPREREALILRNSVSWIKPCLQSNIGNLAKILTLCWQELIRLNTSLIVPYKNVLPKPHHSWFWKNIIKQGDSKLREGHWRIGTGFNVHLNHQNWFPSSQVNLDHPSLLTGTVGDLIEQNSKSWKADLVRTLYPFPLSKQIL